MCFHLHHFSFTSPILISFFIPLSLPVGCLFSLSLSLYLYYTLNLPGGKFLILFTGNNSLKKEDAGWSVYKIWRSNQWTGPLGAIVPNSAIYLWFAKVDDTVTNQVLSNGVWPTINTLNFAKKKKSCEFPHTAWVHSSEATEHVFSAP